MKQNPKAKSKKKQHKKRFRIRSFRTLKIYLYIREIINYLYIRRIIKKESSTEQWQALKLRADWVGRIYTVLNIRKEDAGEEDTVKRAKVFELMLPLNNYIKKLDLHEIVFPAIEKQSDRSYLVVYSPLFRTITFFRTVKYIFWLSVFIYLCTFIPDIINFIKTLI